MGEHLDLFQPLGNSAISLAEKVGMSKLQLVESVFPRVNWPVPN